VVRDQRKTIVVAVVLAVAAYWVLGRSVSGPPAASPVVWHSVC
jgi:hypothetical protein